MNGSSKHASKHSNSLNDGDSRSHHRRVIRHVVEHHRIRHHNHYAVHKTHDETPDLDRHTVDVNDEDYPSDKDLVVDVQSPTSGSIVDVVKPTSGLMVTEFVPSEEEEMQRRYGLLKEIKARIEMSEDMSKKSIKTGTSKDDPIGSNGKSELTSKMTSSLYERRQARRRRSLRAVSVNHGTESSLAGSSSTKFQTNRPVRWRLLDDGIGSKIPLIEQKALLDLSFRMWSEVSPIKFVEDKDADIRDVDIQVAFGKR